MGFELSVKFRLRYLIAREYPRGLRGFILVHDPPRDEPKQQRILKTPDESGSARSP
jgi:hypothetical protein